MSSLPLLLNLIDELDRDTSLYENDFGFGLYPQHLYRQPSRQAGGSNPTNLIGYSLPLSLLNRLGERERQISRRQRKQEGGQVSQSVGKDGFQVCMDVSQFKPSELNVKVVDNSIVVEGKHEEREDEHGYISRHFVRRYTLPKDYDAEKVQSTLSSDGVLTVSVPKPAAIEQKSNERIIQIQQTGPAHLNVKENAQEQAITDATNGGSKGDTAGK